MLEGLENDTYWDWKNTLGPLEERPGFQGVWEYQQTNGLGMMEYLYWAEDMDLQIGQSSQASARRTVLLMRNSHWRLGWTSSERRRYTTRGLAAFH